jgi:hypothetical protein
MMSADKLEVLSERLKGLSAQEIDAFVHTFIGALSTETLGSVWVSCLETAETSIIRKAVS